LDPGAIAHYLEGVLEREDQAVPKQAGQKNAGKKNATQDEVPLPAKFHFSIVDDFRLSTEQLSTDRL